MKKGKPTKKEAAYQQKRCYKHKKSTRMTNKVVRVFSYIKTFKFKNYAIFQIYLIILKFNKNKLK